MMMIRPMVMGYCTSAQVATSWPSMIVWRTTPRRRGRPSTELDRSSGCRTRCNHPLVDPHTGGPGVCAKSRTWVRPLLPDAPGLEPVRITQESTQRRWRGLPGHRAGRARRPDVSDGRRAVARKVRARRSTVPTAIALSSTTPKDSPRTSGGAEYTVSAPRSRARFSSWMIRPSRLRSRGSRRGREGLRGLWARRQRPTTWRQVERRSIASSSTPSPLRGSW